MKVSEYALKFEGEIVNWDEAIPLGNGRMGCLIYRSDPLRIHLDRVDLWDNRPAPQTAEDGFCYENLIRLVKSGTAEAFAEHNRLFDQIYANTTPTKITGGSILLKFGCSKPIAYELDLLTATCVIRYPRAEVKVFCSATERIGEIRVTGERPDVSLAMPAYLYEKDGLDYEAAEIRDCEDFLYALQHTKEKLQYGIFIYRKETDCGSDLYFSLEAKNGALNPETIRQKLVRLAQLGETLEKRHRRTWRRFWQQSEVSVPDREIERQYYLGNYFLASCSMRGGYPMPLQGVWTADDDRLPPWKGDYHHDLNTQFSYSHCLKANHLTEGRVYLDYLWKMRNTFQKFTRKFYGVDGILIPAVSTLNGQPLGGWPQYSFSPTMTIWCIRIFEEYWSLTGDETFLRERAFPYFQEVATAISALLKEKNGKLFLPLSTSPEIHNSAPESYLEPNTNNDLALLKYLYRTLSEFSRLLGYEDPYGETYSRLEDYHEDGCLLLDSKERLMESHRHHSHMMGIYPLKDAYFFSGNGLCIFKKTMDELERLGVKEWVGFSFTWASVFYSLLGEGTKAFALLKDFCRALVSPNGFHLNGDFRKTGLTNFDYRPFTLESNMSFCDAVQNMLLFYADGVYHLFGGVPDNMRNRKWSFRKLREAGGLLFSASIEKGFVRVSVRSQRETTIVLELFQKIYSLKLKKGTTAFVIETENF